MPLTWLRKGNAGQVQIPAIPLPKTYRSSTTLIPAGKVQMPSKMELLRNRIDQIFGHTSGRSTHAPTPALSLNVTRNDITTSASVHPSEGNNTTVMSPNNLNRASFRLGELLKQEASNLWSTAYNELSNEYKQDLECVNNVNSDKPEELEVLKQLLENAMKAKREYTASQWKLKWSGKEINVQEKAEKLVGWITKFKEVADIVVQYDPVHAALPWAGIRFILVVCPSLKIQKTYLD